MSTRQYSSRTVRLGIRVLGATALAAPLLLTSCDHTDSGLYHDADECAKAGMFSQRYCEDTFRAAEQEHTARAPQYATREDCEKDWSNDACDQQPVASRTSGGGSSVIYYYRPHMSGYWTGYTSSPSPDKDQPPIKRPFAYPAYTAKDGTIFSPVTNQSFEQYGRVYTTPNFSTAETVRATPRPVFMSGESFVSGSIGRGGFGATARGFGFGVAE